MLSSPSKDISHPSFSYLPFSNLTHQTETEIANRWETTNSNPHGPIIMIRESETGRKSQIIFMTLFFWNVLGTLQCFVPATAKYADMQIQNHFSQANQPVLTFPHPILICRLTNSELCWSCCSKVAADFLDKLNMFELLDLCAKVEMIT